VPYQSDGKTDHTLLFPVLEPAELAMTHSTGGRIPRTLAKLQSGQPVKIVCWGDSITAGGDASTPEQRYPAVFERALKAKYPKSAITLKAVAAGGSTSRNWLYADKFPYPWGNAKLSFDDVLKEKPDLVTIEFANDAYIDKPETLPAIYEDISKRLQGAGAEVILITPSFFNLDYMHFHSYYDQDSRQYEYFARKFANDHGWGIADASSRWEHLVKEGIPYTTYLNNSINHPDDRGHQMFVDELMKSFP
jgi:lysophospholipase L1-like esterase